MDFNFTSQICTTKEQSKILLALGLKKETSDMYYPNGVQDGEHIIRATYPAFWDSDRKIDALIRGRVTPAWSLHRLIEMIPDKISYPTIYDSAPLRINKDSMYYLHRFFDKYGDEDFSTVGDDEAIGSHNVYDYAVSVIGFLIKEGYFNKEYLEE